jgi:hypothetical protein
VFGAFLALFLFPCPTFRGLFLRLFLFCQNFFLGLFEPSVFLCFGEEFLVRYRLTRDGAGRGLGHRRDAGAHREAASWGIRGALKAIWRLGSSRKASNRVVRRAAVPRRVAQSSYG